jgi:hypothetical protein
VGGTLALRNAEITLLTNCTSRKRRPATESLQARSLPIGDLNVTSREWVSRIEAATQRFVASHLYCGRAISETLQAGKAVDAEIAFLSAGLGIVEQYQKVPGYSLTVSSGYPDSIGGRIDGAFHPASWWEALAKAQGTEAPLSRFIQRRPAKLIVVALPSSYLAMVSQELSGLHEEYLRNLRIIGPRRLEEMPVPLRSCLLPYDGRLDNPESGMNGTGSDFPHRALRHFVSRVLPKNRGGSRASHAESVEAAMSAFTPYRRPRGKSASDDDVKLAIVAVWKKHAGHRANILRELRSVLNVACEQSRFRDLANQVEAEVDAAPKS